MNTCEGEQNKPLENMLCWPIAKFELEVLEEKQAQGGPFDPHLSLWKWEINLPCERYHPWTRRAEGIFINKDRELRAKKAIWTNLGTSSLIYFPSPNSFVSSVLHKFMVSLSKGIKVSMFTSFEFHIFMQLLYITNQICFSPVSPVNLPNVT